MSRKLRSFTAFEELDDFVPHGETLVSVIPHDISEDHRGFLLFTSSARILHVQVKDAYGYLWARCNEAIAHIEEHDEKTQEWHDYDYGSPEPIEK